LLAGRESWYVCAMSDEPESLILRMLREMRADITDLRENSVTKTDLAEVRSELKSDISSLRADMAADLLQVRKELGEQIVGLRRAVIDYHTTVIGHGMLVSDLGARVRRVEQHLNLPPLGAG